MTAITYAQISKQGPFPERIDPWVEQGHYFHQVHGSLIGILLRQIGDELFDRGYIPSREASLQITDQGQPDLIVHGKPTLEHYPTLDYAAVASALHVKPGIAVDWELPELDAIYIKRLDGTLVTVVELISPSNKADRQRAAIYLQRRAELIEERNVNVVEFDLTRSKTRLFVNPIADDYPYHIAVYLPSAKARLLGISLEARLEDFALPLRGEGLSVKTHEAYATAYQEVFAAPQIMRENGYAESELPFPSLMTADERQACLDAVAAWKAELATLRPKTND